MELDLSAFEEHIQATFLVVNYLSNLEFGRRSVLETWGTLDSAHYPAKRALEATFFGRIHCRQDISNTGALWYGKSLRKLARDLNDPKEMCSTSVLRSAIVLTMYEIAKAVSDGKRTFLEQSDWLVVPWENDPDPRPRLETLFDVACRIPGLIEERKKLSAQKQKLAQAIKDNQYRPQPVLEEAYHSVASALGSRCDDCLHQLRMWKSEWDLQSDLLTQLNRSPTTPGGEEYPQDVLGPPRTFGDLPQANLYALYHAILCAFLTIAYEVHYESCPSSTDLRINATIESLILKPSLVPPATEFDHLLNQRHESAVEICRSAPYHYLDKQHGCGGAYVVLFPLLAARQVFVPGGPESRYIESMLPCAIERLGLVGLQSISPGMRFVNMAGERFVNLANARYNTFSDFCGTIPQDTEGYDPRMVKSAFTIGD
ncbi:MAG: hypothetical protein Q9207_004350 [Kuettlingeria erythrocarpa]